MKKLFILVLVSVLVGCASEAIPMYDPDASNADDRVMVADVSDAQQPDASHEDASPETAAADVPIAEDATDADGAVDQWGFLVVLDRSTPPGRIISRNADSVGMFAFSVWSTGSDAPPIDSVQVHHFGVGATSDIQNVYLYDDHGHRLSTGRGVDPVTQMVTFPGLDDGMCDNDCRLHRFFVIVCDFAAPASGGQHGFEIVSPTAITARGAPYRVTGSYPIRSNVFTVGTELSARLDVRHGSQPVNPHAGSTDAEIANFTITAHGGDIDVQRLTMPQHGDISNASLTNLRLFSGSTVVAHSVALENGYAILRFPAPIVALDGIALPLSLHAQIGAEAGRRIIRMYVEYPTDVQARDGAGGAAICISATERGGCSTAGQGSFDGQSGGYSEVTVLNP